MKSSTGNRNIKCLLMLGLIISFCTSYAQVKPTDQWWLNEPYRNLREIDAIDFDIDKYANSIKDIGANTVLINVGGIVANYYTDLEFQYQNPNLKIDLIKEVVAKLHQEGIRVMGRFDFSKINEKLAAQKPEWLYKNLKGESVNFNGQVHTCLNGGYQQEYALKILDETLRKFPLDGVFFNMIGYSTRDYSNNYQGICQADACRNRFQKWSGGLDLPVKEDTDDPVFRKYQQFKSETSDELFFRIHDLIKSFGNQIAICTYTYAGTDFYRKEANSHAAFNDNFVTWEYQAAHNVKSVLGSWKGKLVSNAAVHFYGFPARHSAEASWLTQQRLFQDLMYGSGLDFYCMGRLDNLEDRTVLENVKNVFQFHKQNEAYFNHTHSGNKVLVLHDSKSENEYKGIYEILTENHILFDVMEHWCVNRDDIPRELSSYDVIVLPEISQLSEAQCSILDKYVEAGGKLLATGFTSVNDEIGNPLNKIRLNALGVLLDYKSFKKEQGTYYRIFEKDKKLLGYDTFKAFDLVYAWEEGLFCKPKPGSVGLLGYIPPAMIGPPEKSYYTEVTDIPGLVGNDYGKGKTAFFTFRIGSIFHHTRHYGHAALVMSALNKLLGFSPEIVTNTSPLVEVSRQISNLSNFEWYALLNHTGQLGNGFQEPLAIQNIKLKFKPQKPVSSIKSLTTKKTVPFSLSSDGWIETTIPEIGAYDVVLVEY